VQNLADVLEVFIGVVATADSIYVKLIVDISAVLLVKNGHLLFCPLGTLNIGVHYDIVGRGKAKMNKHGI